MSDQILDFSSFTFPSPNLPHVRNEIEVLEFGPKNGPGVLLMHEASGVSPTCLDLARELANDGFRVFVPVMFGEPGQDKKVDIGGIFCMRKEIHFFASSRTSPITELFRRLVVHIAQETRREKVGVIGMCLSGNLVFALMGEPNVAAAVASQPSLPFPFFGKMTPRYKKSALSVDPGDLIEAVRSRTPLLALRFSRDWMCPLDRFDTLGRTFPGEVLEVDGVVGKGHSVLTADRPTGQDDKVPVLVDFLRAHLCV